MKNKAKSRADGQLSALAGEFFVAAELLKRGLQTSVTFGNAKAIDLFTRNSRTGTSFTVQVKALRSKNYFPIKPDQIAREHIYIFVLLNRPGDAVQYFIVPGLVLVTEADRFGRDLQHPTFPGIHPKFLKDFEDNWQVFEG